MISSDSINGTEFHNMTDNELTEEFSQDEEKQKEIKKRVLGKQDTQFDHWSEGFLYKVALPELKNSPIMYFVIHNSVVLSKILKIVVP